MTREKTIRLHRELWNWLADNPEEHKEAWPEWKHYRPILNDCFLCQYANELDIYGLSYGCCLLDWETTGKCFRIGSLYDIYNTTIKDLKERSQLARKIANLKEAKMRRS